MIVVSKGLKNGVDLGIRRTFSDMGKTVLEHLEAPNEMFGTSFLGLLK